MAEPGPTCPAGAPTVLRHEDERGTFFEREARRHEAAPGDPRLLDALRGRRRGGRGGDRWWWRRRVVGGLVGGRGRRGDRWAATAGGDVGAGGFRCRRGGHRLLTRRRGACSGRRRRGDRGGFRHGGRRLGRGGRRLGGDRRGGRPRVVAGVSRVVVVRPLSAALACRGLMALSPLMTLLPTTRTPSMVIAVAAPVPRSHTMAITARRLPRIRLLLDPLLLDLHQCRRSAEAPSSLAACRTGVGMPFSPNADPFAPPSSAWGTPRGGTVWVCRRSCW